jgi:hypothetical protein
MGRTAPQAPRDDSSAGSPRTGATVSLDRSPASDESRTQRPTQERPVRADTQPTPPAHRPLRRSYIARGTPPDPTPNAPNAQRQPLRRVRRRSTTSDDQRADDYQWADDFRWVDDDNWLDRK